MPDLLFNPTFDTGRLEKIHRLGQLAGIRLQPVSGPDELTDRTAAAASRGDETVLVAGGDGTLHHAIRGLAGTECALGVVPLGTGNDLARALGLPLDPLRCGEEALKGRRRRIDLGHVEGLPFACVLGLGIDSEVNRRVAGYRGRLRGPWVYPLSVLRTLATFRAPRIRIDFDGGSFDGPALLAAIANGTCFGGGMKIAPQALLDDGWLDLVIVRALGPARALFLFPRVYRGTHLAHASVTAHRVRRAVIRADRALQFYGDGEPLLSTSDSGRRLECWRGALWIAG